MRNEQFWTWFDEVPGPHLGVRRKTFTKMFEHLDGFDRPVIIVETGCCRSNPSDPKSWTSDGCSTVLFDKYVGCRDDGSLVWAVDIKSDVAMIARCHVDPDRTTVDVDDSVEYLQYFAARRRIDSVDLLYLDSYDFVAADALPSAVHAYKELIAALPLIRPDTLVAIDDSPPQVNDEQRVVFVGKGFLLARHMQLCGAELKFWDFQVGWTGVGPVRKQSQEDLKTLVARARAHVEADQVIQADQLYQLVLGLTTPPNTHLARVVHGEACAFYAKVALSRDKIGAAADWYREAIATDPLAADYRLCVAHQCYYKMGALPAAQAEAERASRIEPDYPEVWHVLGGIYHQSGMTKQAIEAYEKQLDLVPDDPDALLDRCTVALDTDDIGTALAMVSRVMGTKREPDALHVMAMCAARRGKHEEAIDLFERAIAAGCHDQPTTYFNMSLSLHAIGRYKEGWVAHEKREGARNNPVIYVPLVRFKAPRWAGEPPVKEDGTPVRLHVHCESGAGDNLAQVRYLRLLKDAGYDVRYEALDSMVSLMRSSFPDIPIMPRSPDYPLSLGLDRAKPGEFVFRDFDYHCPIGSLPAVMGTDIDSVPQNVPYLRPSASLIEHYDLKLLGLVGNYDRPRIGLCWSSGIRRSGIWIEEYGLRKSMSFETLMRGLPSGPAYVSLQVGPERAQNGGSRGGAIDVLPEKPTWEETAALVANLDLVITVDTGLAHLVGGMGREVWVMAQRDAASWHFLCWREGAPWNDRSPWYPTARVFRQHEFNQPHHWEEVVHDVAQDLVLWAYQQKRVS